MTSRLIAHLRSIMRDYGGQAWVLFSPLVFAATFGTAKKSDNEKLKDYVIFKFLFGFRVNIFRS